MLGVIELINIKMGIKKRKFAAIPEDYYPTSFIDIFIFTFLLIILIGSYLQ
jgi:hypothetical protein